MSISIEGVRSATEIASDQPTATTGTTSLGQDAFLKLLTAQMQNQDPLEPMSNQEFVAQLAQFSSLEQLQNVSKGMENLYLINSSINNTGMTNLIGKYVVANGDTFSYSGEGDQSIRFTSDSASTQTTVTIQDADGRVVYSETMGGMGPGEQTWSWDGTDLSGQPVEEGQYTFSVSGKDADGNAIDYTEMIEGVIDQMSFANGNAQPTVNGVEVSIADIVRLMVQS